MTPNAHAAGRLLAPASTVRWFAAGLLAVLLAGCGSASIHQAPAGFTATSAPGQVQLSWTAVPGAKSYTLVWQDQTAGETGFPHAITDLTATSYLHTGLIDLDVYQYQVFAVGSGGKGPGSVILSAQPGPIPATVSWTTVVTQGSKQLVYFETVPAADSYRIYTSYNAASISGTTPTAGYVTATASPYTVNNVTSSTAIYYRVMAVSGLRLGAGGPIVPSATFTVGSYTLHPVSASLGDLDADGCLDLVGAKGNCAAGFTSGDLATEGLDGVFATGRTSGDTRIVDVNGDGKPDIFADVDSAATDTASQAILYMNQGNDTYLPNASVTALGIGGYGGTVLAADFNNDGYVDIFAPHAWNAGDGGRNWLLINDGAGNFTDQAAAAGLAAGPTDAAHVPEGGEAVDFNEDGWVDILFGSRLMINNGNGTFTDASAAAGLPLMADHGMKLADVNMDGQLDLVWTDGHVTYVSYNNNGVFGAPVAVDGDATTTSDGLTACDVNDDGFEDVVVASNAVSTGKGTPHLLLSVDGQLMRSDVPFETTAGTSDLVAPNDLVTCGDLDKNGVPDVVSRWDNWRVLKAALPFGSTLTIRVLGAGGEHNQQGRIVRIVPAGANGRAMVRVVDSGAGLRSQGPYDLLVAAPWPGDYQISVRFKDGWVTTTAQQGTALTIYADGTVADGLK